MTRLVLVGGGHAHLEVLRQFAEAPVPGLSLTLISDRPHTLYSGMVPGVVAGDYTPDAPVIPLAPLAQAANAHFLTDEVCGLDLAAGRVMRKAGEPVPFDLLSLDIGGVADLSVPGVAEHAIPTRPMERLLAWLADLDSLAQNGPLPVMLAVVGGGAAGCELALALTARLGRDIRVTLNVASPTVLPGFPSAARRRVVDTLEDRLGSVVTGTPVVGLKKPFLSRGNHTLMLVDAVLWATGVAAPAWLRETGLALDAQGFIRVDRTLRSVSDPRVFAAGDVAAIDGAVVPKAGVWAVRAGPVLAGNLRRAVRGDPLRVWRPQRRALALINAGWQTAIGVWGPFVFAGHWVWRWKDRIDRRFVARYRPPDGAAFRRHAPDRPTVAAR